MTDNNLRIHGTWSTQWTFILAAAGSAIGLGNLWKFPYIAGANGGGAFVLVYLLCIVLVGLPVMMAEIMLGRRGRQSPINSMRRLTREAGLHGFWNIIGWLGVVGGILILSYYAVVAGWALQYVVDALTGEFQGTSAAASSQRFATLLADRNTLVFWQSIFMILTVAVVAGGVVKGLGVAVRVMMPILLLLLGVLLIFGYHEGDFAQAWSFMFSLNFEALTLKGVLVAMGHSFFTLSLGMGAIMAYGAYMPDNARIGSTVLTIGGIDTAVSLIAGLAIFPMVFAHPELQASEGPGLLFVSLPVAFGNMAGGLFFGGLFFILVTLAAWSSAISLVEPGVAWLIESKGFNRFTANLLLGTAAWVLGLGTVLSFNAWQDYRVLGFNFFEFMDFITASVMLPLTGLFIAIFVGWVMKEYVVREELATESPGLFRIWYPLLRYCSSIAVAVIFVVGLYEVLLR